MDEPAALLAVLKEAQSLARAARHEEVLTLCDQRLAGFSVEDSDLYGEMFFVKADSLRHLGRWHDAAEAFAAVAEAQATPASRARAARALRLLSDVERRSHHCDPAVDAASRGAVICQDLRDYVGLCLCRISQARALSSAGQGVEAQNQLLQVLGLAELHVQAQPEKWALTIVAARTALSLVAFRRDNTALAEQVLDECRNLLPYVKHPLTLAAYYRQTAIVCELTLRYSSALRYLVRALVLYDRVRFEPGCFDAYWSMSLSFRNLGDPRTAELCLQQCADIATRLDMKLELSKSRSSFALLAMDQGQFDRALSLFQEDLRMATKMGERQALGHCHRNMAHCYESMGDLARAIEHATASMDNFEATGRAAQANASRILLTQALIDDGQFERAADLVLEAGHRLGSRARPAERASWLLARAGYSRALGEQKGAIAYLRASLALQEPGVPTRQRALTELTIGSVYGELGETDHAVEHLGAAVEIAALLGLRKMWERGLEALAGIDVIAAQRLRLQPYLPNRAVEELSGGNDPGGVFVATAMFVDLRSSTAISSQLDAKENAAVVDAFLAPVVRIILRHHGTVDKFIGDCVVAVFGMCTSEEGMDGVCLGRSGAAQSAVEAGLEIIEYLDTTREVRRRTGAAVLEAGIGVDTGEMISGCFGPLVRRDYTVLGYHVNLARRLQELASSVTSNQGSRMVVSGDTLKAMMQPVPAVTVDPNYVHMKGIDPRQVTAWLVQADEALDRVRTGETSPGAARAANAASLDAQKAG